MYIAMRGCVMIEEGIWWIERVIRCDMTACDMRVCVDRVCIRKRLSPEQDRQTRPERRGEGMLIGYVSCEICVM